MLTDTTINVCIAFSMMFMTFCLVVFVSNVQTVLFKAVDTLGSIKRLSDTLQQEVQPTAVQLREVMDGINQIRGVTTHRITQVTHQVEDVAQSVNTAVDQTKKHSAVWGTGLLAGIQEYLYGKHNEQIPQDKQLTMDRGEHNELK